MLLLLAIVLSVIQLTAYDYLFGIFKLFFNFYELRPGLFFFIKAQTLSMINYVAVGFFLPDLTNAPASCYKSAPMTHVINNGLESQLR